jgi:hypothetical protein
MERIIMNTNLFNEKRLTKRTFEKLYGPIVPKWVVYPPVSDKGPSKGYMTTDIGAAVILRPFRKLEELSED